jgi:hypothetical protein
MVGLLVGSAVWTLHNMARVQLMMLTPETLPGASNSLLW